MATATNKAVAKMEKQVAKVEMYGKTLVIIHKLGANYPFRVYSLNHLGERYHIDSFNSFQEAWEEVTKELWN